MHLASTAAEASITTRLRPTPTAKNSTARLHQAHMVKNRSSINNRITRPNTSRSPSTCSISRIIPALPQASTSTTNTGLHPTSFRVPTANKPDMAVQVTVDHHPVRTEGTRAMDSLPNTSSTAGPANTISMVDLLSTVVSMADLRTVARPRVMDHKDIISLKAGIPSSPAGSAGLTDAVLKVK